MYIQYIFIIWSILMLGANTSLICTLHLFIYVCSEKRQVVFLIRFRKIKTQTVKQNEDVNPTQPKLVNRL